jgi:hypothetical protein
MTELDILHTEARIKQIKSVIDNTRKNSTNLKADEMAIEMLAMPELQRAEARLAELKGKHEKFEKLLTNLAK